MGHPLEKRVEYQNYYDILEIPFDSTQEEISKAYHRSKNTYSQDSIALYSVMTKGECEDILLALEEAYSILGDPSKRSAYDKARGFSGKKITSFRGKSKKIEPFPDLEKPVFLKNVSDEDFSAIHKEAEVSKIAAVNRFALDYTVDPQLEEQIESCEEFTGEFLKTIREYKGVDIGRMSDITKISKTYIRNIENEDFDNLPALVYIRGFVYQYAKTLQLNPDYVANSYTKRLKKR
ncbi:MAG: helix-turn-helix domain-containing protein [Bacteriovoracales bacterium]|nr:helix-turn-helix domain-containing protein [Bacteriovoracales bacterium]